MSDEKKQDERVGALWNKTSSRGTFMTGTLELTEEHVAEMQANQGKLQVIVFMNEKKTGNQPDWRVLKSKPRLQTASPSAPRINDEDVPF
jgi:uncharacterized protein (DUF736 family)